MGDQADQPVENPATMVTTADGWIRSMSPEIQTTLGWTVDVAQDRNWFDLIHPADTALARRAWSSMADTRRPEAVQVRLWSNEQWATTSLRVRPSDAGLFAIEVATSGELAEPASQPTFEPATESARHSEASWSSSTFAAAARPADQPVPQLAPKPATPRKTVMALDPTIPGSDVPERRVAARLALGAPQAPMLEIDAQGRTLYVGGDWGPVVGPDVSGPAALEALLNSSDQAVAVLDAMDGALRDGEQASIAITSTDQEPRWVKVIPIPAPNRARVHNALIAISATPEIAEPGDLVTSPATRPAFAPASAPDDDLVPADDLVPDPVEPASVEDFPPAESPARASAVEAEEQASLSISERLQPVNDWVDERGLDVYKIAFAAGVVLVALLLRTIDLSSLPTGFHGDEAIFGIESQRVLDNGSIGVYTGSALGQPTAPFYLGVFTIGLLGPTVFATRILAALAGTLTVAAVYLIVQKRFDHRVAAASAFALAVMAWNIHFSRIAFGLAWWPLSVVVAIAAVDRATKTGQRKHWFIAGALSAFGVYVYNSHWSFGLALVVFMLVWLVWPNERRANRDVPGMAMGVLGGVIVLFPMMRYALDDKNGYFNHFTTVSRRKLPEWTEASFFGKVETLIGWYLDAWNNLLFNPLGDGVDASGVVRQVPLIFTILAAVGVAQILRKHRTAFSGLVLVTIVVLPIGPSMTLDGITRREFAMSPLLAILAGVGAVAVFDFAKNRVHVGVGAVVAVVIVAVMLQTSVRPYFTTFRDNAAQQWVFADELTESVDAIQDAERDGPVFVNWYSARHYYHYETLRFLLDGTPGIDRAPLDQGFIENPDLTLFPDTPSNQIYVMIGDYTRNVEVLRQLYPQGRVVADEADPPVVAYLVPAG